MFSFIKDNHHQEDNLISIFRLMFANRTYRDTCILLPIDLNFRKEIYWGINGMSKNQGPNKEGKEPQDQSIAAKASKQASKYAEAKKSLKCGLCSDKFHEPKLLSCLHSFCLNCLRRYVEKGKYKSKFPCPLCSRNIDIPKTGGVKVRQL